MMKRTDKVPSAVTFGTAPNVQELDPFYIGESRRILALPESEAAKQLLELSRYRRGDLVVPVLATMRKLAAGGVAGRFERIRARLDEIELQ